MKVKTLISALEKNGFQVKIEDNHGQANGEKYTCSFWIQGESAICVNLRRYNDVSDSQTDYHAGFFAKTIKRVIETLKQPKAA